MPLCPYPENVADEVSGETKLNNLEVLYNVSVEDITQDRIRIKQTDNAGRDRVLPFDTVILSRRFGERKPNDTLFEKLQGKVGEVYKIGDCAQVREIKEAIWSANEVARKI